VINSQLAVRHWGIARLAPVLGAVLLGVACVSVGGLSSRTLVLMAAVLGLALLLLFRVSDLHVAVLMLFAATIPLPIDATLGGFVISIKDLALAFAIAAWLIQRPPLRIPLTPGAVTLYGLGFALIVVAFVSTATAQYSDVAFRQMVSWLTIGALTFMLSRTLRSISVATHAFILLVVVTDLVCLDTLAQLASHGQVAPLAGLFQRDALFDYANSGVSRPQSVFGSSNVLAGFLAIIAPLPLYLATHSERRILRMFAFVSLVLIAIATLATLSRGGIIAEVASILCYLVLQPRSRRRSTGMIAAAALAAAVVGAGLTVGVVESATARFAVILTSDLADPFGRPAYWALVSSLLDGHELFGLGPDNLRLVNPFLSRGLTSDNATAHNLFLQALMETGFVGLAFFCLFAARLVTLLIRPASTPHAASRDLARLLLSCWLGVAAVGMTEYLATSELQNLYALLAALTLGLPMLCSSGFDSDGMRVAPASPYPLPTQIVASEAKSRGPGR